LDLSARDPPARVEGRQVPFDVLRKTCLELLPWGIGGTTGMPAPEAHPRRAAEKDGDVTRHSCGPAVDSTDALRMFACKRRDALCPSVLYQARGVSDPAGRVTPRKEIS